MLIPKSLKPKDPSSFMGLSLLLVVPTTVLLPLDRPEQICSLVVSPCKNWSDGYFNITHLADVLCRITY
jgi:hypothetical protein